jgi:hypothetical protein
MSDKKRFISKSILAVAAFLSCIASAAYACPGGGRALDHSLCFYISHIGIPGILIAAAVSIGAIGGHGGGPLGMLLLIATPINFLLYVGAGVAAQTAGRIFRRTLLGVINKD